MSCEKGDCLFWNKQVGFRRGRDTVGGILNSISDVYDAFQNTEYT